MITGRWAGVEIFEEFYTIHWPQREEFELCHVADGAYYWLTIGHGAKACGGNFSIFLTAFAFIVDRWIRQPNMFDWAKETPSSVLDMNCSMCQRTFDPQFFSLLAHDPDFLNRRISDD